MRKICYLLFLLLAVHPVVAQVPQFFFNAVLSGAEATPPVASDGKGMISLIFSEDLAQVTLSGMVTGLEGSVVSVRLHEGAPGEQGALLVDLGIFVTGRLITGEFAAPAGLSARLFQGRVYAEVRTAAYPDGEIRGQFVPQTDLNFSGDFSGGNMVPAVNTGATGIGVLHYPVGSREVVFVGGTRGLSGPVTGIAIYKGNPGETGQLILDTTFVVPGELVVQVIRFAWLDANFLNDCIAGKYYAVLKTAAFPNGEIRGQFGLLGYLNAFFTPNGFLTIPASNSPAFGIGLAMPNATLDSMSTIVLLNGLDPNDVTVRRAPAGLNGPIVHLMEAGPNDGYYQGVFPLSASDLQAFNENRFYLDVRTNAHPTGEIRGQIVNSLRKAYAFDLCGTQAVPSNGSTALGMAMVSVDQIDCYIDLKVLVDGLSGAPTTASLSLGAPGQTGPVLYGIPVADRLLEDFHGIDNPEGQQIDSGLVYINIATPDYPDGEIRGQVGQQLSCPLVSSTGAPDAPQVAVFPNPARDLLTLDLRRHTAFSGQFVLRNLLGSVVLTQDIVAPGGEGRIAVPLGKVSDGMYQATLTDDAGRLLWSGKLILMNE